VTKGAASEAAPRVLRKERRQKVLVEFIGVENR
jgi:hypothetical protein